MADYSISSSSALLRLPVEILKEIFEYGYYDPEGGWWMLRRRGWTPKTYREFCLAVSWTCSRLRSIIIDTRKCWRHITVDLEEQSLSCTNLVELYLQRSATRPFYLYLTISTWENVADHGLSLQVRLRDHAWRCHTFALNSFGPPLDLIPSPFGDIDLPSLQTVYFLQTDHLDPDPEDSNRVTSSLRLSSAPITNLRISSPGDLPRLKSFSSIALSALKRLNVKAWIDGFNYPKILFECPALESLCWEDDISLLDSGVLAFEPSSAPFVAPSLLSLRLNGFAVSWRGPLVAPKLKQIILDDQEALGADDFGHIPTFISNSNSSFPRLERIAAATACLTGDIVRVLMDKCLELEDISIVFDHVGSSDSIHFIWESVLHSIANQCSPSSNANGIAREIHFELDGPRRDRTPASSKTIPTYILDAVRPAFHAAPNLFVYLPSDVETTPDGSTHRDDFESKGKDRMVIMEESLWSEWPSPWTDWSERCY